MSNESLDDLISDKTTASLQDGNKDGVNVVRPKLRKIKRPKIRVATDIPQAPEKENPISDDSFKVDGVDFTNNEQKENPSSSGTNLVSAIEANNMVSQDEFKDSYILDGLPPELDYVTDDTVEEDEYYDNYVKKSLLVTVSIICFIVGVFMGKILLSTKKVEQHGLEGVVMNPDVPNGRPRCGLTDKSQACVFYLMNWYKQELNGRDFYRLAAQLTGREEYMIGTDNLRYANVKIKPGHFAQLNIPALK